MMCDDAGDDDDDGDGNEMRESQQRDPVEADSSIAEVCATVLHDSLFCCFVAHCEQRGDAPPPVAQRQQVAITFEKFKAIQR